MSGVSGAAPGLVGEAQQHIPPVWAIGITGTQDAWEGCMGSQPNDPFIGVLPGGSRCIKRLWENIKASIHHPSLS